MSKDLRYTDVLGRKIEQGSIVVVGNNYGAHLTLGVIVGFTPHGIRHVVLIRTHRWYSDWNTEPTCMQVETYKDEEHFRSTINYINDYGMDKWDQPTEHHTMKNRMIVQPESILTPKLKKQYNFILDYFCIRKPEFRSRWETQLELV